MLFRSIPKPLAFAIFLLACFFVALVAYKPLRIQFQIRKWNPENAVTAAQQDFKNGKCKVYLNGTIASQIVGVSQEDLPLVTSLPTESAGVGCIVESWKLRNAQREYAIRYNQEIVKCLRKRAART